ncbi:hypothetical protein MKZ38_010529 [Zalerion maritima]|uniref:Dihydrofolate synthetase n=1 Tax=Zalerion maritima TaxID=339359 RepID=A0AAD5RS90_9PEZI|nr:hypothetical protein MKZ38_010529 [Zalerion maritima]
MPISLGLARISRLLAPIQQPWKAIHIAGTNGKGSTAFYLSQLLGRSGIRAGVFTTPHLIHPRESIKCVRDPPDSKGWTIPKPISEGEYSLHIAATRESAKKLINPEEDGEATEFEILTAAAFRAFAGDPYVAKEAPIDVGVIECGVGGARDATNAMTAERICTLITTISHDHGSLIGRSISEIAAEKAGIMRPDVPCIATYPSFLKGVRTSQEADDIVDELEVASAKANCPLEYVRVKEILEDGMPKTIPKKSDLLFMVSNFALAMKAFEAAYPMKALELTNSMGGREALMEDFIFNNRPPGRLQHFSMKPLPERTKEVKEQNKFRDLHVILDGAHNEESARALHKYLESEVRARIYNKQGVTWILAMSKGRDPVDFFRNLRVKDRDIVYAVTFPDVEGMPWVEPMDPGMILNAIEFMKKFPSKAEKNAKMKKGPPPPRQARVVYSGGASYNPEQDKVLMDILETQDLSGPIIVTGSMYLVSYFLALFEENLKPSGAKFISGRGLTKATESEHS